MRPELEPADALEHRPCTLRRVRPTPLAGLAGVTVPAGRLQERPVPHPELGHLNLVHDEYIVYDTRQQRPLFLVEVEFVAANPYT